MVQICRGLSRALRLGMVTLIFLFGALPLLVFPSTASAIDARFTQTIDMLGATYLDSEARILFCGKSGVLGTLTYKDGDVAVARLIQTDIKEDFLTLETVSGGRALIGSSQGNIYSYQDGQVLKLAGISEYSEPVLDIHDGGDIVWAGGGRGMLARSADKGSSWNSVSFDSVQHLPLNLPSRKPGVWYLGVSNIDTESVKFQAEVNGRPAVVDEDFEIDSDEGRLIINNPLDEGGVASIEFNFKPGPPYRGGDVTWSVVIAEEGMVTIAGEFGLILQSSDDGKNWVRRNGAMTEEEPKQLYWLSGAARGKNIILGGAAGKVSSSKDGGLTWMDLELNSREGVFGAGFIDADTAMVAGAVGLLGLYRDGSWEMADRTALELRSWMSSLVNVGADKWMVLGGRSTVLAYVEEEWKKMSVEVSLEAEVER
ncbi:MAG: hypothetical protein V7717_08140 [Porticoccaceae bacterium]